MSIRNAAEKARQKATPPDHLLKGGDPIVPLMAAAGAAARKASRLRRESSAQQGLAAKAAEAKVRGTQPTQLRLPILLIVQIEQKV